MTPEEARTLVAILVKARDVLRDLSAVPNQAVPPGLWQAMADAVEECGDPGEALRQWDDRFASLSEDELHKAMEPPSAPPALALERAAHHLLYLAAQPSGGNYRNHDADAALEAHGLVGKQLVFKKALIDHAHTDYVAHGRVNETPKGDLGAWKRTRARLRRALGPSATTIDSLSHVPGFGFLGFVSEAVSGADHAVALAEDV